MRASRLWWWFPIGYIVVVILWRIQSLTDMNLADWIFVGSTVLAIVGGAVFWVARWHRNRYPWGMCFLNENKSGGKRQRVLRLYPRDEAHIVTVYLQAHMPLTVSRAQIFMGNAYTPWDKVLKRFLWRRITTPGARLESISPEWSDDMLRTTLITLTPPKGISMEVKGSSLETDTTSHLCTVLANQVHNITLLIRASVEWQGYLDFHGKINGVESHNVQRVEILKKHQPAQHTEVMANGSL